jgi:arsenite-transporting ATPase
LLGLSLPGIDEVAALIEIARVGADRRFGLIVVDTAPTGHTLRMLTMPKTLGRLASTLDRLMGKHRVMAQALTGTYVEDDSDALIAEIDSSARRLASLLQDSSSTHMTWVTLPEAMSVEETRDAAGVLARSSIQLGDIIVNRVTPPPPQPCRWCDSRRASEAQAIRKLRLPNVRAIEVAARSTEPRGIKTLARMGEEITAQHQGESGVARSTRGVKRRIAVSTVTTRTTNPDRGFVALEGRLLLFGGKGGVGKTTCAAATAVSLAAAPHPVLLLSTDPAHSLADVLGQPVSNIPRRLRGLPASLLVREIDAARQLDRIRKRYARTVDDFFDGLASRRSTAVQVDLSADRDAMQSLIELAPPGLDELAAIIEVVDAVDSDVPGTLVIETAPSGLALRLLEDPEFVLYWF